MKKTGRVDGLYRPLKPAGHLFSAALSHFGHKRSKNSRVEGLSPWVCFPAKKCQYLGTMSINRRVRRARQLAPNSFSSRPD